jgi:oxygen-independent coproporphyrinogen-3 oxidase
MSLGSFGHLGDYTKARMPLGLYVHLPFCATHCAYCPFVISTNMTLEDRYFDALLTEISSGHPSTTLGMTVVDTLYLGGGTPSRSSLANLSRFMLAIRDHFTIEDNAEVTLEANPEDVTADALDTWQRLGVNRVSIGVQSFRDEELQAIGRLHDAARARAAVTLAIQHGFRTNLDLILGLPQQTVESFRESLDAAIEVGTGHLSLYMLDLDEKTPLAASVARGRTRLPDEDDVADLYIEAIERLGSAGLAQYEISNFAREGDESRHNLRYWRRDEYLGLGVGAHSFASGRRFANTRDIHRYIADPAHGEDFAETLTAAETRHELLFLKLRQTAGINYDELAALGGQEAKEWTERGLREGWLRRAGSCVAFTPAGFLLSNDYISQLF